MRDSRDLEINPNRALRFTNHKFINEKTILPGNEKEQRVNAAFS